MILLWRVPKNFEPRASNDLGTPLQVGHENNSFFMVLILSITCSEAYVLCTRRFHIAILVRIATERTFLHEFLASFPKAISDN